MTTVYVVTCRVTNWEADGYEHHLVGVYSSKEAADSAAMQHEEVDHNRELDCDMTSVEMDMQANNEWSMPDYHHWGFGLI